MKQTYDRTERMRWMPKPVKKLYFVFCQEYFKRIVSYDAPDRWAGSDKVS